MTQNESGVLAAIIIALGGFVAGIVAAINSYRQARSVARKDELDILRESMRLQAEQHARDIEKLNGQLRAQSEQHEKESASLVGRLQAQDEQHEKDRLQWSEELAFVRKSHAEEREQWRKEREQYRSEIEGLTRSIRRLENRKGLT